VAALPTRRCPRDEEEDRVVTQVPEGLNDDIEEPLRGRLERDPAADGGQQAVEEGPDYERAVEEDTVLAPDGDAAAPPADDDTPQFREPGEGPR
jgi:hypothetical protein